MCKVDLMSMDCNITRSKFVQEILCHQKTKRCSEAMDGLGLYASSSQSCLLQTISASCNSGVFGETDVFTDHEAWMTLSLYAFGRDTVARMVLTYLRKKRRRSKYI
jgi:hypothetical protein